MTTLGSPLMTNPKETLRPAVASERVAEILAQRILSGQLPPGARIKQDELAEELNTSRIPVRDALRILETRGLVTLRANAGARVVSMTLRDLEISYEIRERIEPLLLRDSMAHLTDQDVQEMHFLIEQLDATSDVEIFLALDRQFHWTAYRRHRAPQLCQMIERLWDTTQSYRRAFAALALMSGARITMSENRLLLHAVEQSDADTAASVLVTKIRRARVNLIKYGDLGNDDGAEQS